MSLIINLAVGGDWPGSPDGSTVFPQTFDVDYARYWTRDETELINPDFDRSGSGLNGWSTFGDSIGNVIAETEAVLDGTHSLKMYGEFDSFNNYSGAFQGIAVNGGQSITADASAFIRSEDSILGTSNEVLMKLEYYSSFGAAHGSPDFLGEESLLIADGSTSEGIWIPHQITDIVPASAVEARVTFLFHQPGFDGGAVHIDAVSLIAGAPPIPGDANGDGSVDLLDLDILGANFGAMGSASFADGDFNGDGNVDLLDLDILGSNFGTGSPSTAVPEPISLGLLLLCAACLQTRQRLRTSAEA